MNPPIGKDRTAPKTLSQKSRIAVASESCQLVDQHFGRARSFLIYEVDGNEATWLETRSCTPYCQGGHGETSSLDQIINLLRDCEAVLASRIGVGPDDRLRQAGIEPVQVYEPIETALLDFYQRTGHRQQ